MDGCKAKFAFCLLKWYQKPYKWSKITESVAIQNNTNHYINCHGRCAFVNFIIKQSIQIYTFYANRYIFKVLTQTGICHYKHGPRSQKVLIWEVYEGQAVARW